MPQFIWVYFPRNMGTFCTDCKGAISVHFCVCTMCCFSKLSCVTNTPEVPYPTPSFTYAALRLWSESCGLPTITSYVHKHVIWVGAPGSIFRSQPSWYSKPLWNIDQDTQTTIGHVGESWIRWRDGLYFSQYLQINGERLKKKKKTCQWQFSQADIVFLRTDMFFLKIWCESSEDPANHWENGFVGLRLLLSSRNAFTAQRKEFLKVFATFETSFCML